MHVLIVSLVLYLTLLSLPLKLLFLKEFDLLKMLKVEFLPLLCVIIDLIFDPFPLLDPLEVIIFSCSLDLLVVLFTGLFYLCQLYFLLS